MSDSPRGWFGPSTPYLLVLKLVLLLQLLQLLLLELLLLLLLQLLLPQLLLLLRVLGGGGCPPLSAAAAAQVRVLLLRQLPTVLVVPRRGDEARVGVHPLFAPSRPPFLRRDGSGTNRSPQQPVVVAAVAAWVNTDVAGRSIHARGGARVDERD